MLCKDSLSICGPRFWNIFCATFEECNFGLVCKMATSFEGSLRNSIWCMLCSLAHIDDSTLSFGLLAHDVQMPDMASAAGASVVFDASSLHRDRSKVNWKVYFNVRRQRNVAFKVKSPFVLSPRCWIDCLVNTWRVRTTEERLGKLPVSYGPRLATLQPNVL